MASVFTKIAAATSLAALVAAGTVLHASPAAAGPNCASGYHCVFYYNIDGFLKHSYFNSDSDFRNDTFDGSDITVNDQVWAASNSSNSGYESHYYTDINYANFLFCVNPGSSVDKDHLPDAKKNQASSLKLRGRTSIHCF